MKKSIIFFSFLICVSNLFAQKKAIKVNAKESQGYLILEDDSLDIECWLVNFSERVWQSTDSFELKELDQIRICGKNYVTIPTNYFDEKRDIRVSIYGFDSNGNKSIYELNQGIGVYECANPEMGSLRRCGVICDGQWLGYAYAYEIYFNEYFNPQQPNGTGSGVVLVDDIYQFSDGFVSIPFYANVPVDQIDAFMELNYGYEFSQLNQNSVNVSPILYSQNSGGVVYSPFNQVIPYNTPYRKIAKNLSKWRNYSLDMTYPNLLIGQTCNFNLNYFINLVNSNPNYSGPDLNCYGENFSLQDGETSAFNTNCLPSQLINGQLVIDSFNDAFALIDAVENCLGNGNSSNGNWWDVAEASFELAFVKNNGSGSSENDVFWAYSKTEGLIKGFSGTLKDGLYKLNIISSEGVYFPLIVQIKKEQVFTCMQKDLLDVNIYPVPVNDNSFTIDLEVGFTGKIKYELLDSNGKIHYSESLDVVQNEQNKKYKIKVKTKNNLPQGTLYNRFTCPDGSVYSKTILNN